PFQNLLVRTAGEYPLAQVCVLDVEKREAMAVEFAAQVVIIGLRKVAARMQADLIEHARKIDKAAGDIVRAARQLLAHNIEIISSPRTSGDHTPFFPGGAGKKGVLFRRNIRFIPTNFERILHPGPVGPGPLKPQNRSESCGEDPSY